MKAFRVIYANGDTTDIEYQSLIEYVYDYHAMDEVGPIEDDSEAEQVARGYIFNILGVEHSDVDIVECDNPKPWDEYNS